MKTVIRIEHTDTGWGIWRSTDKSGKFHIEKLSNYSEFEKKHKKFPIPSQDELEREKDDFFAFKSLEQMKEWVTPEELKEFISLGFKVYLFDLGIWQEGKYQIMFKQKDVLQKKDITQLFI